LSGDPDADALLSRDPLALTIGMLLDQQVPIEWAFRGPYELARRLGRDTLEAAELAGMDPERLTDVFVRPPALHRYPAAMAKRVQALCAHIVDRYGGDIEAIWRGADDAAQVLARLQELPGFGAQKARIFLALLGKQCRVRPAGWREAAGGYGEEAVFRSAADVTDAVTLARVRAYKKELKAGK
jgi:uncharacterized HhH-GPD family protein